MNKTAPKPKRIPTVLRTQKEKRDCLSAQVAICFAVLDGLTTEEIARKSGLSKSTVYRLYTGRFTINSRYGTIQALGAAAGLVLNFEDGTISLSRSA